MSVRSWTRILLVVVCGTIGSPLRAQSLQEHRLFTLDSTRMLRSFAFSPDSRTLVAVLCHEDTKANQYSTEIARWDVETGKPLSPFRNDEEPTGLLAFRPDGQMLLTSTKAALTIRDANTGKTISSIPQESDPPDAAAFRPDGQTVFGVGGGLQRKQELRAWDVAKQAETVVVKRLLSQSTAAFSPDGKTLAWSCYQDVDLWDVATRKEIRALGDHRGSVSCLAFSADARKLAVGATREDDRRKEHSQVKLWDVTTGKEQASFEDLVQSLCNLAISPDGRLLVVIGAKTFRSPRTLRLFEADSGRERTVLSVEDLVCMGGVRFSPDGRRLAVGWLGGVRIWNVVSAGTR
jgi:WD40 repeat protein